MKELKSKLGMFRPKREKKTIHPKDSILLGKLSFLELTNLAENIDMVLTDRQCPEVVSVLAGEKGFRIVGNAFAGCHKTVELCQYLVDRLGPTASRFTVIHKIIKSTMYNVKLSMQLKDGSWIDKELTLPQYKKEIGSWSGEWRSDDRVIHCLNSDSPIDYAICAKMAFDEIADVVAFKVEIV